MTSADDVRHEHIHVRRCKQLEYRALRSDCCAAVSIISTVAQTCTDTYTRCCDAHKSQKNRTLCWDPLHAYSLAECVGPEDAEIVRAAAQQPVGQPKEAVGRLQKRNSCLLL
jgi:hypothetical protein